MKCKICGSENIVKDGEQFVCQSCGAKFFEAPEDNSEAVIKEAQEAIEAKEAEKAAKEAEEAKAAAEAEAALRAEEARIAEQVLNEAEAEKEEEKTEAPAEEENEEAPESEEANEEEPQEVKIFEKGEPLYEAQKMADEPIDVLSEDSEEETEEEAAEEETKGEGKKKKSAMREVLDFCLPIIIALIVAMLLKTFVFANAQVPTGSMLNTIQKGDRIIASRIEYNFHEPERYYIIIFKNPDDVAAHKKDPSHKVQYFVKRVIGLPGETVEVVNGVVYVTDENGKSEQLKDDFVTACTPTGNFGPYEVPKDSYFVMGDNRENSIDSRFWSTTNYVDKNLIIGKVKFRYYPSIHKIE